MGEDPNEGDTRDDPPRGRVVWTGSVADEATPDRRSEITIPTPTDRNEPGEVAPERVAVYIDGFNVYHGLMDKGWGRYRWLDYVALMERFMLPHQELVLVKYFTSLMRHQPSTLLRQEEYLRALEARGGIEVIRGEFEARKVKCRKCGEWYKRPQEKKTDVNLATHLIVDGFDDRYDRVILMTADSDLVPAAKVVVGRLVKALVLLDPPRRHCNELVELAHAHLHVGKSWMARAQLPNPVEFTNTRGKVKRLWRPDGWDADAVLEGGGLKPHQHGP